MSRKLSDQARAIEMGMGVGTLEEIQTLIDVLIAIKRHRFPRVAGKKTRKVRSDKGTSKKPATAADAATGAAI